MKFRSSKAAGSFDCAREGAFELLIHMEADPHALSYAEFDLADVLPRSEAHNFFPNPAAYLVRHRAGLFVVSIDPDLNLRSLRYRGLWREIDALLARRGTWLLSATRSELRREPRWSNALKVAHCAQAEIDPEDQERVINYLTEFGPAPALECMKLCTASADSYEAILRLISAGVLFLDHPDHLSTRAELRLEPPRIHSIPWLQGAVQPLQRLDSA